MCRRRLAAGAVAAVLAGCAAGPDYARPDYDPLAQFALVAGDPLLSAEPEVEWWQSFDDPVLSDLIEVSLRRNHDLRVAAANLAAARALLREAGFERFPIVDAGAEATRSRTPAATRFPGTDDIQEVYDVSLDMRWELDFFGRVRRAIEALRADYEAALAAQRAVQVRVAAEVGSAYVVLRGAQLRLAVARRNAANQRETFELTEDLLQGGRGTALDIARARAQLESTLAGIPALETERDTAIHRLNVLTGRAPDSLDSPLGTPSPVPQSEQPVAIGDPGSLLRRRPDVAASERELAAATARIGVNVADLFPRVSLIGSAGRTATAIDDLSASSAETFAIGPQLRWAAFDLGRVRARIDAAEAGTRAALARYEQTVLIALQELQDAIVDYSRNIEVRDRLEAATAASQEAAQLSRLRFRGGADSFLTVLDAERRLLEAEDRLATSQIDVARSRIAIYKALGGGWPGIEPVVE